MPAEVFVSYSHRDEVWKDRVVDALRSRVGDDCIKVWSDRDIAPGQDWFTAIEEAMNRAAVAVCLVSSAYLQSSFCLEHEVGPLLDRREHHGLVFIPVLVSPCDWVTVHWLKPIQMLPRDGRSLSAGAGTEDEVLARLAERVEKAVADPAYRPPADWEPAEQPEAVDLDRLPPTGYELVGRDAELARLSIAWRAVDIHVFCLTGWGGVGKSTLVNKWLERLAVDGYAGARRVFGWSFSAPTGDSLEPSADDFVHAALAWFGDPAPRLGSPWAKGERLAELIAAGRNLLVLDGLEPMQSTLAGERGRIRDPALATLLDELARRNKGLCLVTSREPVTDLLSYPATVAHADLERLTPRAGRALLSIGGVRGLGAAQLEAVSMAVQGHALALRLVASVLREGRMPAGDAAASFLALLGHAVDPGDSPTRRILEWIDERWEPSPARELLTQVSVLGGHALPWQLDVLRAPPPVDGLNGHTGPLDGGEAHRIKRELRRGALLLPEDERWPDRLEAHPVVVRHFDAHLNMAAPEAWRTAHRRLSERHAERIGVPGQAGEDAALAAIHHAGRSGDVQRAVDILAEHVDRGPEVAAWVQSPGALLSALLPCFVPGSWTPAPGLAPEDHPYLLNKIGMLLRSLGRLQESASAFAAALEGRKEQGRWANAGKNACNVSEVALATGAIEQAVSAAREAVQLAHRSGQAGQFVYALTTLGDALHQSGDLGDASRIFAFAEEQHRKMLVPGSRQMPTLYRLPGIRWAELMLTLGQPNVVLQRANILSSGGNDISDEESAYGITVVAEALREAGDPAGVMIGAPPTPVGVAEMALNLLRASASDLYLPRALLARARGFAAAGDAERAIRDAERAIVVASRMSATLQLIDARLERVRIEVQRGQLDLARKLFAGIGAEVERLGYGRRRNDVARLESAMA